MMLKRGFFVITILAVMTLLLQGVNYQAGQASSPVYLEGRFIILWGDGASGSNRSEIAYFLATPQLETIRLVVEDALLMQAGGTTTLNRKPVVIQGTWLDNGETLGVQSLSLAKGGAGSPEGIYGPQPWVSILCKFRDVAAEPNDINYFQGMYSAEYPGLDHYWREQSFDLANLEGSGAFGWFVLPHERAYYLPGGMWDWWTAAQECTAAADSSVDFSPYVGINLMFNDNLDCCAWGGSWNACLDGVCKDWRMTWEPPWGYQNIGIIGHETGHGFGLPHSYWNYNGVYDNKWDVMSDIWANGDRGAVHPKYGVMGQHTISYHKDMLGWIDPSQMAVINLGEARTITLERLALPQGGNYLGARIMIDDVPGHFLTVEARQLVGYDSWLPPILYGLDSAVVLHDVHVEAGMPARVIDVDGNGDTGDPASMWLPGETYITPTLGIEVSVLSATETGFLVSISNQYIPMRGVEINGPEAGTIFENITLTSTLVPTDVVGPITYAWQASGQVPITNTGGLTDTVSFVWEEPGTQAITVTASNGYEDVTDYFSLPILVSPVSVDVGGPEKGNLQDSSTFTATVVPLTTTVPITYNWSIDGELIYTHTAGVTDTATFTWDQPGLHEISVTAANLVGTVSDTWSITIYVRVYLPSTYKH